MANKKPSQKPAPKPATTSDDLLRQGVEKAKRAIRGETPDLRKKR